MTINSPSIAAYRRAIMCGHYEDAYQVWLSMSLLDHIRCLILSVILEPEERKAHIEYCNWEQRRIEQ